MAAIFSYETVYGKPARPADAQAWDGFDHRLTAASEGLPEGLRVFASAPFGRNQDGATLVALSMRDIGAIFIQPIRAGGRLYGSISWVQGFSEGGLIEGGRPAPGRHYTLVRRFFFDEDDWCARAPALLREVADRFSGPLTPTVTDDPSSVVELKPVRWLANDAETPKLSTAVPQGVAALQQARQPNRAKQLLLALGDPPQSFSLADYPERSDFLRVCSSAIALLPRRAKLLASYAHGVEDAHKRIAVSVCANCVSRRSSIPLSRSDWEDIAETFRRGGAEASLVSILRSATWRPLLQMYLAGQISELNLSDGHPDMAPEIHARLARAFWAEASKDTQQRALAAMEKDGFLANLENDDARSLFKDALARLFPAEANAIFRMHVVTFLDRSNAFKVGDFDLQEFSAIYKRFEEEYDTGGKFFKIDSLESIMSRHYFALLIKIFKSTLRVFEGDAGPIEIHEQHTKALDSAMNALRRRGRTRFRGADEVMEEVEKATAATSLLRQFDALTAQQMKVIEGFSRIVADIREKFEPLRNVDRFEARRQAAWRSFLSALISDSTEPSVAFWSGALLKILTIADDIVVLDLRRDLLSAMAALRSEIVNPARPTDLTRMLAEHLRPISPIRAAPDNQIPMSHAQEEQPSTSHLSPGRNVETAAIHQGRASGAEIWVRKLLDRKVTRDRCGQPPRGFVDALCHWVTDGAKGHETAVLDEVIESEIHRKYEKLLSKYHSNSRARDALLETHFGKLIGLNPRISPNYWSTTALAAFLEDDEDLRNSTVGRILCIYYWRAQFRDSVQQRPESNQMIKEDHRIWLEAVIKDPQKFGGKVGHRQAMKIVASELGVYGPDGA